MDPELEKIFEDAAEKGRAEKNNLTNIWKSFAEKFEDKSIFGIHEIKENSHSITIYAKKETGYSLTIAENKNGTFNIIREGNKSAYKEQKEQSVKDAVAALGRFYGRFAP